MASSKLRVQLQKQDHKISLILSFCLLSSSVNSKIKEGITPKHLIVTDAFWGKYYKRKENRIKGDQAQKEKDQDKIKDDKSQDN